MKVKYISELGFFDNLTYGKIYTVVGENRTQFIVNNDLGLASVIQKDKFEIVE